ncbi:MAG TPA: PilZ domain-containing protein [Allosphingosinicella sp.]|nr:PilZ domain-containing protein [Allosphingosinicella sp.]
MDISFEPDRGAAALDMGGELFADGRPARTRVAPRNPVNLAAGARRAGGTGVAVRVNDLSTHGFCMETHLFLTPGTDVWLRLPSLEMRHARVAWVRGALVGCAFEAPLAPYVVDLVVQRARQD